MKRMLGIALAHLVGLLAFETLLFTFGGLVFRAGPETLVLASSGAIGWFAFLFLARRDVQLPRQRLWIALASVLVAVLAHQAAGDWMEDRLWSSGQFGEPPFNRVACLYPSEGIIEMRVRNFPIADVVVSIQASHPLAPQDFVFWFDSPEGYIDPEHGSAGDIVWFAAGENRVSARLQSFPITRYQSLYVKYEGERELELGRVHFGPHEQAKAAPFPVELLICSMP